MRISFLMNLLIILKVCASFALRRKVAIVTGGTRGIGYGISEALAKKQYDLLLSYNNDYESAMDSSEYLKR